MHVICMFIIFIFGFNVMPLIHKSNINHEAPQTEIASRRSIRTKFRARKVAAYSKQVGLVGVNIEPLAKVVVSFNSFNSHPYLGKIPILTNIFQMGSFNHQLVFPCKMNDMEPISITLNLNFGKSFWINQTSIFGVPALNFQGCNWWCFCKWSLDKAKLSMLHRSSMEVSRLYSCKIHSHFVTGIQENKIIFYKDYNYFWMFEPNLQI